MRFCTPFGHVAPLLAETQRRGLRLLQNVERCWIWRGTTDCVCVSTLSLPFSLLPLFPQEFCSFLLDGLHEDLNRVSSKVYMEEPDNDGVPDVQAADRSWQYHLRRNNSIIVDLFQGQFKSTLQCRTCRYTSVTFSPFMFLSLPLPANASRASLDACIRLFTATEHVRGADEWCVFVLLIWDSWRWIGLSPICLSCTALSLFSFPPYLHHTSTPAGSARAASSTARRSRPSAFGGCRRSC